MNIEKNKTSGFTVVLLFLSFSLYLVYKAFSPQHYTTEIEQGIGGTLICNSTYYADHHTWEYEVKYDYEIDNKIIHIGTGWFCGREWDKKIQLKRYNNWTILQTGDCYNNDKVIIGSVLNSNWKEYIFSPQNINADSLWQQSDIQCLVEHCCWECYVDSIIDSVIVVNYKFRVEEYNADKHDSRSIHYIIDKQTGVPIMRSIENIE